MCLTRLSKDMEKIISALPFCGTYYKVVRVGDDGKYYPRFRMAQVKGRRRYVNIPQTCYGKGTVHASTDNLQEAPCAKGQDKYRIGIHAFVSRDDAERFCDSSSSGGLYGEFTVMRVRIYRKHIHTCGIYSGPFRGAVAATVVADRVRVI